MANQPSILVLKRGDELTDRLNQFAKEQNLTGAWLNGLGGSAEATLGFYDIETKSYNWQDYSGAMEVVSLSGNLSWPDGQPFWHIHGVLSDDNMRAVGGHVKRLKVGLTLELLITPLEQGYTRKPDPETGLNLMEPLP